MPVKVHRAYPVTLIANNGQFATIEANHYAHPVTADTPEELIEKALRHIGGLARRFGAEALPVAFFDNTDGTPALDFGLVDREGREMTADPEPDPQIKRAAELRYRNWARKLPTETPAPQETDPTPDHVPAEWSEDEALAAPTETHRGWTGLTPAVPAQAPPEHSHAVGYVDTPTGERIPVSPVAERLSVPVDLDEEIALTRRQARAASMDSFVTPTEAQILATQGWQGSLNALGFKLQPSKAELEMLDDLADIEQGWGGNRARIATANPKGGEGKTPLLLGITGALRRFAPIDNAIVCDFNEAHGNSATRAQVKGESTGTVMTLARAAEGIVPTPSYIQDFTRIHPQEKYRHVAAHQPQGKGDHLRSEDVASVYDILGSTYGLIGADTSNDTATDTWETVMEHTDQLIIPIATEHGAEAAREMRDRLLGYGGHFADLVANAVVVVTVRDRWHLTPARQWARSWDGHVREVHTLPYDRHMGANGIHFDGFRQPTQRALVKATAAVVRGLRALD